MAKQGTSSELATPTARPAWLAKSAEADKGMGMETAQQRRVTPRMLVLQGTSAGELLSIAGAGGILTKPDNKLLIEADAKGKTGTLDVVPIATFITWQKRADQKDKDGGFIIEEEYEPGRLAQLAMNPATRNEPYGNGKDWKYTYCEAINYVFLIVDCPANPSMIGRIVAYTFTIGEHYTGQKFNSHLCDAYQSGDPIFCKRVRITTGRRERNGNAWYGIDICEEQPEPYIDEALYAKAKQAHLSVAEMVKARAFGLASERPVPGQEEHIDDTSL